MHLNLLINHDDVQHSYVCMNLWTTINKLETLVKPLVFSDVVPFFFSCSAIMIRRRVCVTLFIWEKNGSVVSIMIS